MENIKPTIAFPIACFPKIMQDYVEAVAEYTQTPIDMSAVAVLSVVATSIQGKFEIEKERGYTESLNLYCMVVANSGEKKSPVKRIVTKPIPNYEKIENKKRQVIIDKQKLELMTKQKELENTLAKHPEMLEKAIILKAEIRDLEAKQIKPLRLIADNATPEALTSLLADNNGKISIISAEGGIFDILNGQYSSKSIASIDTFLNAYCRDDIIVDRKGRESERIENPTMTIFLAVQEIVLEQFMSNDIFRGRGLNARFLYCIPTSKVGKRIFDPKGIPSSVETEYNSSIDNLLKIPQKEKPTILKLSHGAYKELGKFFYWVEPQFENELEFMKDWANKFIGTCLRIAGIVHCMEYSNIASGCPVSEDTMKKAITISKYFLEHSKYAYMLAGENKDIKNAKYILKKLEEQEKMSLKRSEILNISRSRNIKIIDDISKALEILSEYDYIAKQEAIERKGAGRKPDIVYELNPLYFKK